MKRILFTFFVVVACLILFPGSAMAQTYYFSLDKLTAHVYVNEDGSASLDYVLVFTNDRSASPIDFVDVGLPNSSYAENSISADVNGQTISDISSSGYQGSGNSGIAVGLGSLAIKPGATGAVHVYVGTIKHMLYPDSQDSNYASFEFSPVWFGSQYLFGNTDMTVAFHMPPGVKPEEPRWHEAPGGWPTQPDTSLDEQGRPTYTWHNPQASASQQYTFGASLPTTYVPESAIIRPNFWETLGINPEDIFGVACCLGFLGLFAGIAGISKRSTEQRKLQYLSPKIAIEGHGIKRGLTAVEAAILLEQPMDKIMTMILFAAIKKNAAAVTKKDPLELQISSPLPDGLQPYETQFLEAFKKTDAKERRKELQDTMVALVRIVATKMKGFSRRESQAYYRDIITRAWAQVEAAQTPEVKSEKYDEVMEWTMLDKDYDDRTRRVFTGGPVFVPTWWGRYDPGYGRTVISAPATVRPTSVSIPGSGSGRASLPHLPGSDFAASLVNGVQTFSAGVIGNVRDFTSGVTKVTNPPPVPSASSSYRSGGGGGGGHSCACACACAGCACACAGGGR